MSEALKRSKSSTRSLGFASALLAATMFSTTGFAQEDHSQHNMPKMDHSQHQGAGKSDAGGMSHDGHMMDEASLDVLRSRIPRYANAPTEQIALDMKMMGGNQWKSVSPEGKQGANAVLVLIHGFSGTGNMIMTDAVQPLGEIFPAAMGAGMAMMGSDHLQGAVDHLEGVGAQKIIVVPLVSTPHNSLNYQWEYIFGKRDKASYMDVPQINAKAEIVFTTPPGAHPLIQEIIEDNAKKISTDPANEAVFLVGHGPHWEEENQKELAMMGEISDRLKERVGFSSVTPMTLQDDAPEEVRQANVAKLRSMIEAAQADGKEVLLVTNLLSARSIQWKIDKDLAGLTYKFSTDGIAQHENFRRWLDESVMDTLLGKN